MELESFLGNAKEDKSSNHSRDMALFQHQTEKFGLHELFDEFDPSILEEIKDIKDKIRKLLNGFDAGKESADFPRCFEPRVSHRFTDNKLLQVAGIIHSAKVIEDNARVQIYDVCGGSGTLSTSIGLLRPPGTTKIVCIDRRPHKLHESGTFREMIDSAQIDFQFIRMDINDFRPDDTPDNPYYLSIHACGNATDAALTNTIGKTLITPCCYGAAKQNPIPDINDEVWRSLCKIADGGSGGKKLQKVLSWKVARTAMRVIDGHRARQFRVRSARVRELTPYKYNDKNHSIFMQD